MVDISVTPNQDAIIGTVHVAAAPERVFDAITDPAQLMEWWGKSDIWRCIDWRSDLRVGGKWQSEWIDPEGKHHNLGGEYREIDPPRLLVYTWVFKESHPQSLVRWELTPVRNGTDVKLTHSGLAGFPEAFADYRGGWPKVLERLTKHCETQSASSRK